MNILSGSDVQSNQQQRTILESQHEKICTPFSYGPGGNAAFRAGLGPAF